MTREEEVQRMHLSRQIAEAQKHVDILLDTPIEALKEIRDNDPKKFAALCYALDQAVNKSQIRKEGKTKSGDEIALSIDRDEERYAVEYGGLVGYDAVTFHCVDALAAEKLFEAFQNVDDVEAD